MEATRGSIRSSGAALTSICLALLTVLFGPSPASAQPFVYVSNLRDSVFVIDSQTNSVVGTIALGANTFPTALALSPDESRLYVATNSDTGNPVCCGDGKALVVVNPATGELIGSPLLFNDPIGALAVTRDGGRVYVLNGVGLDVLAGGTSTRVNLPFAPLDIALSPRGDRAYLAQFGTILVLDTATNTIIHTNQVLQSPSLNHIVSFGPFGRKLAVTPDGSRLYVGALSQGGLGGAFIDVFDAVDQTLIAAILHSCRVPVMRLIHPDSDHPSVPSTPGRPSAVDCREEAVGRRAGHGAVARRVSPITPGGVDGSAAAGSGPHHGARPGTLSPR